MLNTKLLFCVLAIATLVAGCTHIPLSTLWRFRSFSVQDLCEIDSAQIRVGLALDEPVLPDLEHTKLVVDTESGQYAFSLEPGDLAENSPIPKAGTTKVHILQLTEQSRSAFERMQHDLHSRSSEEASINVGVGFKHPEGAPVSKFRFGVLIQLNAEDGFFTLIETHWI